MNIMFSDSITDDIKSKYILLELDTFYFGDIDRNQTAYCLVETVPIMEIANVSNYLQLHQDLIKNFKRKNWKYCEDAIEHLMGNWNKEIDTFYQHLIDRMAEYKENDPGPDWSPVLIRT